MRICKFKLIPNKRIMSCKADIYATIYELLTTENNKISKKSRKHSIKLTTFDN